MAPETHDHNIIVSVLEKQTVVDKTRPDGTHVREENVLVADETGCMYLTSRGGMYMRVTLRLCAFGKPLLTHLVSYFVI